MHTKDDSSPPDTKPELEHAQGNLEPPPPKNTLSAEKKGNLEPPPPAAPIKPLH